MTNRELFKEAIAEAKSIREAAIINAKEALEESLTPQIKSLLAQRLAEMEEEEISETEELQGPAIAENDEEEKEEKTGEEEGAADKAEDESEDADIDLEDMSMEDLKDLVRDIVSQMVDKDGDGDHDMDDHGMEEPAGDMAPKDDLMSAEEEEIDLDEILRELEGQDKAEMSSKTVRKATRLSEQDDDYKYFDEEEMGGFKIGSVEGTTVYSMEDSSIEDTVFYALERGADVQFLAIEVAGEEMTADEIQQEYNVSPKLAQFLAADIQSELSEGVRNPLRESKLKKSVSKNRLTNTVQPATRRADLKEALRTIEVLKNELQEVNLLNAKLLYINKLFKAAKTLSENQKASIITTFDKAATVKEAQLVFESLKQVINTKQAAPIRESKLGIASAPTAAAPTKKPEIIAEVSDAVKRMQKLAGIIK
jgi:hypothetical protein